MYGLACCLHCRRQFWADTERGGCFQCSIMEFGVALGDVLRRAFA